MRARVVEGAYDESVKDGAHLACTRGAEKGEKFVWLDLGIEEEKARDALAEFWAEGGNAKDFPMAKIYRKTAGPGKSVILSELKNNWAKAESEEFGRRIAEVQARGIEREIGAGPARDAARGKMGL